VRGHIQGELARQAALTHRHESALHTVTSRETESLHRKCEQADQRARQAREEAEDALRELHAEQAARAASSAQVSQPARRRVRNPLPPPNPRVGEAPQASALLCRIAGNYGGAAALSASLL